MFDKFLSEFFRGTMVAVMLVGFGNFPARSQPGTTVWEGASGVQSVNAGGTVVVRVRVRNNGSRMWDAWGARRTMLSAMVVDASGNPWPAPQARAALPYPVPSDAAATCIVRFTAPKLAGRYRLLVGRGDLENRRLVLDAAPFSWDFEVVEPVDVGPDADGTILAILWPCRPATENCVRTR